MEKNLQYKSIFVLSIYRIYRYINSTPQYFLYKIPLQHSVSWEMTNYNN